MKTTQPLQEKFAHFAQHGERLEPIFTEIAQRLCDRLLDTKHTFPLALDIGAGKGSVCANIPPEKKMQYLCQGDFSLPMLYKNPHGGRVVLNGERPLPFPSKTFDLVTANMVLAWVKNAPRFLAQAGRVLKEDGLFIASTLGDESFKELAHAFYEAGSQSPHTNPLPPIQDVGAALQSVGFALPVVDRDLITLTYPDFKTLWADLKAMGATNTHPQRRQGLTTPRFLEKVKASYHQNFAQANGTLPLTLEVIYLHGWRPHHSQQKPLPRGSAVVDFANVL